MRTDSQESGGREELPEDYDVYWDAIRIERMWLEIPREEKLACHVIGFGDEEEQ